MPLAKWLLEKYKVLLENELGEPDSIELTLISSSTVDKETTFTFELRVYNTHKEFCTTTNTAAYSNELMECQASAISYLKEKDLFQNVEIESDSSYEEFLPEYTR